MTETAAARELALACQKEATKEDQSSRDRVLVAFLLYLQTENECGFRTGRPCREPERCGCWLEMQQYVETVP